MILNVLVLRLSVLVVALLALLERTSLAVVNYAQYTCLLGLMLLGVLAVDVVGRLAAAIGVLGGTPDGILNLIDLLLAHVELLLREDFAHVTLTTVAFH